MFEKCNTIGMFKYKQTRYTYIVLGLEQLTCCYALTAKGL